MSEERLTRRDVLKKAAYMTPVILTFLAAPAFASGGSGREEKSEAYGYDGYDERVQGNGKRGQRWLWNERQERRERKKHWPWD